MCPPLDPLVNSVEILIINMILCRSCCSEKNVHVVCPTTQDSESKKRSRMEMDESIKEAFQSIKDAGKAIDTLIFVYSGHHYDSGFQLTGNDKDVWSHDDLCRQIEELHNVHRVIAFLDCSYGKRLALDCRLEVAQFCSSKTYAYGSSSLRNSPFIMYLIQALTHKATNSRRCFNGVKYICKKECVNCKELNTDIITSENLEIYLRGHIKELCERHRLYMYPTIDLQGSTCVIGFNMRFYANVLFKIKSNGKEKSLKKDITQVDTIYELKKDFLKELFERKYVSLNV